MKQSDISQQLGSLISAQGSVYNGNNNINDSIPSELEEPAPAFEVDCKSELLKSKKEAETTLNHIVNAVVPEEHMNHPAIKNQIRIDSIQLGSLYFQQNMNNIVLENSILQLSSGDNSSRHYEVIEKLIKRAGELTEQITSLHAQFRKYYIDTYLDIESKQAADEQEQENLHLLDNNARQEQNQIEDNSIKETESGGFRILNTKEQNKALQELKTKKKKEELSTKTEEVSFEEI